MSNNASGQAVSLGEAGNFTIVTSQGLTNAGASVINGNVALSPLTTITGFSFSTPAGPGVVTGSVHYNDASAMLAQANALTAYNTLAGMAYLPANNLTGLDLGGRTLTPGVYHFNTSVGLTGNLILNTLADPNAVFVFQIGSTLTTAVGSSVTVIGAGAATPNVFWQVGSSATLNTASAFSGNILANQSISLGTGSSLANGRALALYGAVTLLGNSISAPVTVLAAPGRYWNGTNSNRWSGVNWSSTVAGLDQVVLGTNVDVVFSVNPSPLRQNTNLDMDVTISSLTVNDPVPVTIGGANTLTISASGLITGININAGAGLTTISSGLELGYLSQVVDVNNVDGLLISGVVSGSNGLTKSGTGVLTLTGAETYSGATVVDGGTLQLGNGITTGSSIASSNSVLVSPNGILALNLADGETFTNSVTDNGQIRWIASGTNYQAAGSVFSGTGSMRVDAPGGTAVVLGSNTYTGGTTVNRGTMQLGDGVTAGSSIASSSSVLVSPNGTLVLNLADGETFTNSVTDNGRIRWIAPGTNYQAAGSVFSGTGSMRVDAPGGTAVVLGNNTYTGDTVVKNGTLQLGDGVTTGSSIASSSSVLVSPNGTLDLNLADGETFANSVTDNGRIRWIAPGTNYQAPGSVFSGTGSMRVDAPGGTAVVLGNNTYTGATVVKNGTLQLGDGVTTGSSIASSSPIRLAPAGTLAINLANGEIFPNSVTNNGRIRWIARGTNYQAPGSVFRGTGSMRVDAAGTAVILGHNTYTGATVVKNGTLQLGDGVTTGSSIASSSPIRIAPAGTLAINLANGEIFPNSVTNNGRIRWIARGTNYQAPGSVFRGTGSMRVDAAGKAVIVGRNTYTGTTIVKRGTLQLGDGVTAGSSIASSSDILVAPKGTFAINLADGETFANSVTNNGRIRWMARGTNYQDADSVFSGTGIMLITAPGTTVLQGDNTFRGGTTIDTPGYVFVGNPDSNTSSPFGTGTLTINKGTIDTVNSQLLQIEVGGYEQTGGKIAMHLEGTNPGDYTRFLVDGKADLSGGRVFVYDQSGNYVPYGGDRQNIIHTTGGLNGMFASNTPESSFYNKAFDVNFHYHKGDTLLYPRVTYKPDNANITWVQDSFQSVPGLTHNQHHVGGGLDNYWNTRPGHDGNLITYLNGQNIPRLPGMYDMIAPDELTAIYQMGFTAAEIQNANIQRHLERVRNGVGPATQYTRSSRDSKGGMYEETMTADASDGWSVFLEGTGGSITVDDSIDVSGYDFDTMGMTLGADLRVSDRFAVGVLGGYGKSDANLVNGGNIDAESFNGAIYATAFKDGFHVDALLGAGLNTYDTRRASLLGYADGEADGWQLDAMINTGYDFRRGNWTFSPNASLAYTRVSLDGFNETGSLSPLSYPTQSQESLRTELGANIAYHAMFNGMKITPQVRIAWQHEFMDSTQSMESRFMGGNGPTFSVNGPHMDRDRAVVSAGVSVQISPTVCVYGFYDGHIDSSGYNSNQLSTGVKIDF